MRERLLSTTMVPQPYQLWQANAGETETKEETPVVAEQDFDEAFAELVKSKPDGEATTASGEPPAEEKADPKPAEGEAAKGEGEGEPAKTEGEVAKGLPDPVQVAAEAAQAAAEAAKAGKEGADAKAAPAAAEPPKAQFSDDALRQFGEIMKGFQPKPEPAKPAETPPAITPFSTEEKALVDEFVKEWPEIHVAMGLIRRQETQAVVDHIFKQVGPIFNQLQENVRYLASQLHQTELIAAVPDIASIETQVHGWIDGQPDFLKAAYKQVAETGTPQQVAAMIERFRAETGAGAPAATPAATPAAAATPTAAAAPKKEIKSKTLAALTPTQSARTDVKTDGIAADDYNAAFEAAAADALRRRKAA